MRPLLRRLRRLRGQIDLASLKPLSTQFGFDRGTPIDRHYIELFLAGNASDIKGTALEIFDSGYCRRFGAKHVTTQHVVDIAPDNPRATIVGDLSDPATLPNAAFDCIVLTQTLHTIYDMRGAVQQVRRALKPGGVALITVPGITPVRPGRNHAWYWSLTADALSRLLAEQFSPENVRVASFGNLFAATSFLHGAAAEEIDTEKLAPVDPAYPVIVAARVVAS